MAMSFDAFLWALTQQESGGNYRAVGVWVRGDRAYGRYQVMGANIPSWTAKYYGKRLTPQQYLNNNAAQDAVVRGMLGGYVKKYGYRGAASAWYSGNPNLHMSTRSQTGGPSIKGYVDSVMNRASGYKGGASYSSSAGSSSFSSSSGGGGSAPVAPKLDPAELAEQYGLSSALINSSKELKSLFSKAVSGGWSPQRFQASLKNTKWWKTQSSTLRKYVTTKYTDPATWHQQRGAAAASIRQMAVKVGLTGVSKAQLSSAVHKKLAQGWSDARLEDWLGARIKAHDGVMYGKAGEYFDRLHEVAYLNGMRYGGYYEQSARNIVRGVTTLEAQENKIRAQAAARYSSFREQILAGQNLMDLAAPYIKSVAGILELAESDVDLFNPHIARAMTAKPKAGQTAGTQMPLWQFENELRNDPLWNKTNNARESMMTVARQVAKDFGMAY
jgi:hypothetical protein